jgi:hypothetical protein
MKSFTNPLAALLTIIAISLTACDSKSDQQKVIEAKNEAAAKIQEAQSKAEQTKLEAQTKAEKEIAEAQRKAAEKIQEAGGPQAIPTPPATPAPAQPNALDKAENKLKDALNLRPNEAAKDLLEEKAADAKDDAEAAQKKADKATQDAIDAAKKAGQ